MKESDGRQSETARVIELMTLSQIPPMFQEAVLDALPRLKDDDVCEIRKLLEEVGQAENEYLDQARQYLALCERIGERVRQRLVFEGETIKQEFEAQLAGVTGRR